MPVSTGILKFGICCLFFAMICIVFFHEYKLLLSLYISINIYIYIYRERGRTSISNDQKRHTRKGCTPM